jgi:hypothetical protein
MAPTVTPGMPRLRHHTAAPTCTVAVRCGSGFWLAPARGSPSCGFPGPLAEARIPARAPPATISILVVTPAGILDTMVLHVVYAGSWVLRMLRSVGQLGPTLGSFTVLFALAVHGRRLPALPLRHPRFHLRPVLSPRCSPQGQRDVAVVSRQAAPPPVVLW